MINLRPHPPGHPAWVRRAGYNRWYRESARRAEEDLGNCWDGRRSPRFNLPEKTWLRVDRTAPTTLLPHHEHRHRHDHHYHTTGAVQVMINFHFAALWCGEKRADRIKAHTKTPPAHAYRTDLLHKASINHDHASRLDIVSLPKLPRNYFWKNKQEPVRQTDFELQRLLAPLTICSIFFISTIYIDIYRYRWICSHTMSSLWRTTPLLPAPASISPNICFPFKLDTITTFPHSDLIVLITVNMWKFNTIAV